MLVAMNDTLNIASQLLSRLGNDAGRLGTAGEAVIRAKAIPQGITTEEQIGIIRLNRAAASGAPFRSDAPRGYYLNIRV